MTHDCVASDPEPRPGLLHRLRRLTAAALGAVLLTGTATALALTVYPMVTGGAALAVLSGSMAPGMPVGAMVLTRPVDPADLAVGDVITFQRSSGALVTHRIVVVGGTPAAPVFTTRGDANPIDDLDPVAAADVRGERWTSVPALGRLAALLHGPRGLGVLVLLIGGVLAASPESGSTAAGRHAGGGRRRGSRRRRSSRDAAAVAVGAAP